jgi:hypothetical protein
LGNFIVVTTSLSEDAWNLCYSRKCLNESTSDVFAILEGAVQRGWVWSLDKNLNKPINDTIVITTPDMHRILKAHVYPGTTDNDSNIVEEENETSMDEELST